jgi:hypothetical protein
MTATIMRWTPSNSRRAALPCVVCVLRRVASHASRAGRRLWRGPCSATPARVAFDLRAHISLPVSPPGGAEGGSNGWSIDGRV